MEFQQGIFTMEREKFLNFMKRNVANELLRLDKFDNYIDENALTELRNFTSELDLAAFATGDKEEFHNHLEGKTIELTEYLPDPNNDWGTARTAINLFLKGSLYNRYLSQSYNLYEAEQNLELPLNNNIVEMLMDQEGSNVLPEWKGITVMNNEVNASFQEFASDVALQLRVSRIHIPLFIWH